MSERKDWKRLHRTRICKDDSTNRFPTPKDIVEGLVQRYGHGLKGKKIHCFADDYRVSWFYKILKERFTELGLVKLTATGYVENGKGVQAVYDGQAETFTELDDDGSMYGNSSMKATQDCDVVFTNPPFKKYSAMLKDVIGKKDFVLLAPHILPYRINDVENQIIYRIAKGEVFIEPKEIAIWNEDHTRQAACVVISTIKPEGVQKVDIELSAKYDPAKHKMFIDAETGKPTGVVNCDKFKDFPVDWPGLVAIPVTTLMKIANQKVRVNDAHGYFGKNNGSLELVDNQVIHGVKSRGDNNSPNMELVDSVAIHGMCGYSKYANNVSAIEMVDSQAVHGCFSTGNPKSGKDIELVDVNDVHGQFGRGGMGPALEVDSNAIHGVYGGKTEPNAYRDNKVNIELVDGIAIHGYFGKGDVENPYIEFGKHKIIKVKLEDGRVPFQRIIVKLNRRAKV